MIPSLANAFVFDEPTLSELVLKRVFSLRSEQNLDELDHHSTLDRVASRVAQANLNREDGYILHVDSKGKRLSDRISEEGYEGFAGEIVAVVYLVPSESTQERIAEEFKNLVRNSKSHYQGLMAQTGHGWTEYGSVLLESRVFKNGYWMQKYSFALVLGLPGTN